MAKVEIKQPIVQEISEAVKEAKAVVLVDYRGLIDILNQIDMEIVCEGIETKEEEKTVYEFGCDSMQGFLYDRPIPTNDFEKKYIV